jgi:hypothetical protein
VTGKLTIIKHSKTRHKQLREQFLQFDREHPEVYQYVVKFTFDRINRGFKQYSVYAVIEQVRWHLARVGGDGLNEFKINNNFRPFYARKFMNEHPEFEGFFETRAQTSRMHPAKYPGTTTPAQVKGHP